MWIVPSAASMFVAVGGLPFVYLRVYTRNNVTTSLWRPDLFSFVVDNNGDTSISKGKEKKDECDEKGS